MPKRLSDTREAKIQTMDEAKEIFNSIATIEIRIAKAKAQLESRIATLKAEHEEKLKSVNPILDEQRNQLGLFIEHHPELFRKPRNVRTSFGSFGIQKANKVKIIDKAACTDFVVDQGMNNCFETTYKLLKSGIKAALEAGTRVTGAKLLKGDIAHYKVDKALLDEAKGVE